MIIAGGVYLEICAAPASVQLLGSGGRAALALMGLTDRVALHAFYPAEYAEQIFPNFEPMGVEVELYPSSDRIAFHYLYPLAKPRISPIPLPASGTIAVKGETVLRFGCLEGDFQVLADVAIYDPQSAVAPAPFGENGSAADRLAVVLNRSELLETARRTDVEASARYVLDRDQAEVVIVKSGPSGAFVLERKQPLRHVAAYETRAVHKVGSGDVFTATFAHYWGEAGLGPVEAAQLASLHTADYVENRLLPLAAPPPSRAPAKARDAAKILLWSNPVGASGLWLHDEALGALEELSPGVASTWLLAQRGQGVEVEQFETALLLVQILDSVAIGFASTARSHGLAVVAYVESSTEEQRHALAAMDCIVEQELATALYRAVWATA